MVKALPPLDRSRWVEHYPRVEVLQTHDLYQMLTRLFQPSTEVSPERSSRDLLSLCFYLWSHDNHLGSASRPILDIEQHVKMEGHRNLSIIDRILDMAYADDIDLIQSLLDSQVKYDDLKHIIDRTLHRFDRYYPPTGHDSLLRIGLSLDQWLHQDMVIMVR